MASPWLTTAATSWRPVRVPIGGVRLGDAGGEQAEIVGQGAVGEVGDACAQDGDGFASGGMLAFARARR